MLEAECFEDTLISVFKKKTNKCDQCSVSINAPIVLHPPILMHSAGGAPESNLSSDMLVHWVKVIWAKYDGSGTPWGSTIMFLEKNPPAYIL